MSLLAVHPKSQGIANIYNGIVLALVDSHAPSWQRQEDKPGFEGFWVKPLHGNVLVSLLQSVLARKGYSTED